MVFSWERLVRVMTKELVLLDPNWERLDETKKVGAGGLEPRTMLVTTKPPRFRALILRVKLPA